MSGDSHQFQVIFKKNRNLSWSHVFWETEVELIRTIFLKIDTKKLTYTFTIDL